MEVVLVGVAVRRSVFVSMVTEGAMATKANAKFREARNELCTTRKKARLKAKHEGKKMGG